MVQNHMDGFSSVYSPAPQAYFIDKDDLSRRFEKVLNHVPDNEAMHWLDRQSAFDPDCWIVETERKSGIPRLIDG